MTDVRARPGAPRPSPPAALASRLHVNGPPPARSHEVLLQAGLDALDQARSAPGRVRASAFHLLAADALLTSACEAAVEGEDPEVDLEGILRRTVARDRP